MIHQINKLPQAMELLMDIVHLQAAVLLAACEVKEINLKYLENYLKEKSDFADRASDIAKWICRKKVLLLEPLTKFADAALEEKHSFMENLKRDVDLLCAPRNESLNLAILDEALPWQNGAKRFLSAFYTHWRDSGFAPFLFSKPPENKYTRQDFLQEFKRKNPHLYLCAICDATLYQTATESTIYSSIEHFFPRKIYPHLSCHPLNLIPICSTCNSYVKGEKDPLKDAEGRTSLIDLILPYQDISLRHRIYVVTIPKERADRRSHPLKIEVRPALDHEDIQNRFHKFNQLYNVEARWTGALEEIEEQTFRRICQFFSIDVELGDSLDHYGFVMDKLNLLMAIIDSDNVGKDPYGLMVVWILKSYIDDIKLHKENSKVFITLKEWAQSKAGGLVEIKKRAEKIHAMVPGNAP